MAMKWKLQPAMSGLRYGLFPSALVMLRPNYVFMVSCVEVVCMLMGGLVFIACSCWGMTERGDWCVETFLWLSKSLI